MAAEGHERSLLIWDVPDAVQCGETFAVTVGLKCPAGCDPDGWHIEVCDSGGQTLVVTTIGHEPWPGTTGLFFANAQLRAPTEPGLHGFGVIATACQPTARALAAQATAAQATSDATACDGHAAVRRDFRVRSVAAPAHSLTVVAIDRETGVPVPGLRVVAHPFRTLTDSGGTARLRLPRGRYRVFVSGRDYFPFRSEGELDSDRVLRAELDHDRAPSDAELWS